MKHAEFLSLALMTTKWSFLLLCATFSLVNSQDTNTIPSTSLLCISDCATCPVICSPPPSPIKLKPPLSPPSSVLLQTPPPPPPLFAPLRPSPPQSSSHSPSPSSPQKAPKSPPPSYMIYTGAPPPPHPSNCPTPPNPPNINDIPATQVPPVQKNYTYPYYYYFSSEAASRPLYGSIVLGFLVVFHFICICW